MFHFIFGIGSKLCLETDKLFEKTSRPEKIVVNDI